VVAGREVLGALVSMPRAVEVMRRRENRSFIF
jgi:hypothetical protein